MSASTATGGAPHLTSASQRKPQAAAAAAAASPSGASTAAAAPATKYSHRQAKAYKPSDLPQFNVPDLTVKELLSAIPAHCFERSAVHSFAYVFFDFALVAALAYAASWIDPLVASTNFASSQNPLGQNILAASTQATALRWSLWGAYTFLQGLVFTGIWVIAHECGHQAFSTSKTLNNAVGWVLHSALLVPYHSWRISHARHHAATGHLTRDEVFVPRTRAQKGLLPLKPADAVKADAEEEEQVLAAVGKPTQQDAGVVSAPEYEATGKSEEEEETFGEWLSEVLEDAPLFNLVNVLAQQLFGWPLYLIQNSSGQSHYPKGTNHFNPDSVIFDTRHRMQVIMSDVGIALTMTALYFFGKASPNGFLDVARYYLIPYLWCNHWLVMITCLQHTDVALPHYKPEVWTFPRGALCTIDRSWLWPIGPYLFHGIAETHVSHHISSKIPHYNAWEATEALKVKLGEHYKYCDENVFVSLWKNSRACKFIDENDKVAFYRNVHGVPSAVVANGSKDDNSDSGVNLSD